MRAAGLFKSIASWPGGTRPAGWQTHRSWDALETLKAQRPAREVVQSLLEFSLRDLQAAYKLVKQTRAAGEAAAEKRRQIDLLKAAYVARQVPDVLARNARLVEEAAARIRLAPPARLAWRSGRTVPMVLALVSGDRMSIEVRLRDLLELQPSDLRAARARSRSYATRAGRIAEPALPAHQVAAALRDGLLSAALALQEELRA